MRQVAALDARVCIRRVPRLSRSGDSPEGAHERRTRGRYRHRRSGDRGERRGLLPGAPARHRRHAHPARRARQDLRPGQHGPLRRRAAPAVLDTREHRAFAGHARHAA